MRIMNAVWILTPLWASVIGLAAYFAFGRVRKHANGSCAVEAKGRVRRMNTEMPDPERTDASATADRKMPNMDETHTEGAERIGADPDGTQERTDENGTLPEVPDTESVERGRATLAMQASHPLKAMQGMEMGARRPRWQSVVLSTLHCGAGCTLADLTGEWLLFFIPVSIGGSLLAGTWVTDYMLALVIGIGFQYAAIRGMEHVPQGEAVVRAAKADFLSLTAWQAGMYGWMAIAMFVLGDGTMASRTSFRFWFMMQIAMCCGFLVSLPVNAWLIRKGIKKGM